LSLLTLGEYHGIRKVDRMTDVHLIRYERTRFITCLIWQYRSILLERHRAETKGSQYPDLVYGIERVGKHDFHVSFYESETGKTKTFTGKEWI
jgi:hypothetical protein